MPKFKVTVHNRHTAFVLRITNRRGRAWEGLATFHDAGNAAEAAMVTEEVINDGVKLTPGNWVEVAAGKAA